VRDADKQEEMIKKAVENTRAQLEQASEEQKAKLEAEIISLQEKLKEAEERKQRAKSLAEQTKSGNVYIISNIGSFGEDVFKIGMTRRFDPYERVKELGDASVSFPFDVHAMIQTEDAPALEAELHKRFALVQTNKVNYRKEFFNAPLKDVREEIEKGGFKVNWTMTAEAREYHETLIINESLKNDPAAREEWLKNRIASEVRPPLQFLRTSDDEDLDAESA
jgi:hypothetical protein